MRTVVLDIPPIGSTAICLQILLTDTHIDYGSCSSVVCIHSADFVRPICGVLPDKCVIIHWTLVITRTALYWNEQQKTPVSPSSYTTVIVNNCWSCTACCRCYQLGYQISAAALHTALNRGPIQCNVEAAHMSTMFMCHCACLSTSLHRILC